MPLLYSEAKEILSKFAGKGGYCPSGKPVDLFVREVMQYMLYEGGYGNEKKFCFQAQKGVITLPHELEVPLKVKIDGQVGTVWDKWYEFHSTSILDNCMPAEDALFEDANYHPTVYDLPNGGARVGVNATTKEDPGAYIIVQGDDPTGREIITFDNEERVIGEKIKVCWGDFVYTQATFGRITHIIKTPTTGYLNLSWYLPSTYLKGFLAAYSPLEERPSYRRFLLTKKCNCNWPVAKVSILGRIRLKDQYSDNDFIPFDNIYALSMAGQTVNANYREKVDVAVAKGRLLKQVVNSENSYKKVNNGTPLEFYHPTSGGSIKRPY